MKRLNDKDFVYLAFSYNNFSIISWIVRILTWSNYSHVAIINPKTTWAIEADNREGVRYTLLSKFFSKSKPEIRRIPCSCPEKVVSTVISQVGKKYDWGFIFGWMTRRTWQKQDAWACSELVAWAFEHSGCPIITKSRVSRVTPEHLYMISEYTEAITKWD